MSLDATVLRSVTETRSSSMSLLKGRSRIVFVFFGRSFLKRVSEGGRPVDLSNPILSVRESVLFYIVLGDLCILYPLLSLRIKIERTFVLKYLQAVRKSNGRRQDNNKCGNTLNDFLYRIVIHAFSLTIFIFSCFK
mmetsp:Transcript_3250/g.6215  ORF Transcript_3250/g.6215 Transcript_3250/m.6215 type:complete len:136 (+) Transcript_3250:1566-1973(+)